MAKVLIVPSSKEQLILVNNKEIDGIILSIKDLSVNNSLYFTINELKELIPNIKPEIEINISLNKIMHNNDMKYLEQVLIELDKLRISKILFYDLSVLNIVKRLNLNLELVIYQEHLNASIKSNDFYYKRGVKYSLITNDITLEEILDIKKESKIKLMMIIYGYLPIFYSRRYLVSSYLEYINKDIDKDINYLKDKNENYPIVEEDYGTTIYTKEPINLVNYKDKLNNLDYVIFNSNYIDDTVFKEELDNYLNNRIVSNVYEGFVNTKTTYKVKDNE